MYSSVVSQIQDIYGAELSIFGERRARRSGHGHRRRVDLIAEPTNIEWPGRVNARGTHQHNSPDNTKIHHTPGVVNTFSISSSVFSR